MALVALLSAHRDITEGQGLCALLPLAGRTLLERQARQAQRAGAARILVEVRTIPSDLVIAIEGIKRLGLSVDLARNLPDVMRLIDAEDDVLLFADGLVVDDRSVDAIARHPAGGAVILTCMRGGEDGLDVVDGASMWAGMVRAPGRLVADTAWRHDDWDLAATLVRRVIQAGGQRVEMNALPTYVANRRRDVPILWQVPENRRDADRATSAILMAGQKGCLDWPARYLHPPVENLAVKLLLPTRITPNMVTVATGIVGLAAVLAFALGWLWTGLVLMLLIGPLDGIDGKLARTRLEFSRWGDLEHVVDKLVEYGAFLALGGRLAQGEGHYGPWAVAALLVGFALAEALQGELYYRFTGRQLDDRGPLERRVRLFAGRRNTFCWVLLPFAVFGLWETGLIVLAVYSVLTFFVAQMLFIRGMRAFALADLPEVAANFQRTSYPFLATRRRSSR